MEENGKEAAYYSGFMVEGVEEDTGK